MLREKLPYHYSAILKRDNTRYKRNPKNDVENGLKIPDGHEINVKRT